MPNMSFFLTTRQFRQRIKVVTRRNGWKNLKAGDQVCAIVKGQGLKKGESVQKLGKILILDVRRERLDRMLTEPEYGRLEVIKEGFGDKSPEWFVEMYCKANRCNQNKIITRIEFTYESDFTNYSKEFYPLEYVVCSCGELGKASFVEHLGRYNVHGWLHGSDGWYCGEEGHYQLIPRI